MKRVIAISLLLAAFVCSLFSVDLDIEWVSIEEKGGNGFSYHLTFLENPDTKKERFVFDISDKPISMFWTLLKPSEIPESTSYDLEVISNSFKSCPLTLLNKGDNYWNFKTTTRDPYALIDFLKILLKDGYIVYTLSPYTIKPQDNKDTQRFFLSLTRTDENEKAIQEALEKLEWYEEFLFLWEYKDTDIVKR